MPLHLWLIHIQPTAKYIAVRSLETWRAAVAAHTQSTTVAKNHGPGYKNITMMCCRTPLLCPDFLTRI